MLAGIVTASIVWCAGGFPVDYSAGTVPERTLGAAETDLCKGDFEAARAAYSTIVPVMRASYRSDGRFWPDTALGYFYSLIATRDDMHARALLDSLEAVASWKAHAGDRKFWDGDAQGAFTAYAEAVGDLDQYPDGAVDTFKTITAAVRSRDDMSAAIEILSKPPDPSGATDVGSLQLLMLGDAYETQRMWTDAFTAWVRAAGHPHAVPDYDYIDQWNISALEMVYYYRAHAPKGSTI